MHREDSSDCGGLRNHYYPPSWYKGIKKPGYNVQIATENQFITNYGLYSSPTDQGTLKPFLESFKERYGTQSATVFADSGYGSEMNYEYMISEEITPFVKYSMFHAEMKRKRRNNPFLVENMFHNKELDFYVCPMGQHPELKGTKKETSDLAMSPPKAYIVQKTALNVL